ncbi:MAG: hypothetical protein QNJ63_31155 [Calothrix sp. MO_192.B10]|nr:hypothetical protein [Calothrix sp. MO_192.B10]
MQAYKVKGKVDATGNLVVAEPIEIPPGDVEIIILQVANEVKSPTETPTESQPETPKKREYKIQALKHLLENAPPTPPDFDPDEARWEALKEKHNL